MGLQTCKIYTLDTTLAHDPIVGAAVRVFNLAGTVFVTSGVTNALGYFQCDLDGATPATRYQVRCSKIGVSFTSPGYIDVIDPVPPGGDNDFDVFGDIHVNPGATDPLLCRASGVFTDPGGRPLSDAIIQFTTIFDPIVSGGIGILSKVEVRTDNLGRAAVDLYRKGKYRTVISGLHDDAWMIEVPDVDGVSLIDLLFPYIASVTFVPAPPWVILHGTSLHVVPTIITSAFVVLDPPANEDLSYLVRDPTIASSAYGTGDIIITGAVAGTTYLDLSQLDTSIKRLPVPVITGTGGEIDIT